MKQMLMERRKLRRTRKLIRRANIKLDRRDKAMEMALALAYTSGRNFGKSDLTKAMREIMLKDLETIRPYMIDETYEDHSTAAQRLGYWDAIMGLPIVLNPKYIVALINTDYPEDKSHE